jgi:hypothetical protein
MIPKGYTPKEYNDQALAWLDDLRERIRKGDAMIELCAVDAEVAVLMPKPNEIYINKFPSGRSLYRLIVRNPKPTEVCKAAGAKVQDSVSFECLMEKIDKQLDEWSKTSYTGNSNPIRATD